MMKSCQSILLLCLTAMACGVFSSASTIDLLETKSTTTTATIATNADGEVEFGIDSGLVNNSSNYQNFSNATTGTSTGTTTNNNNSTTQSIPFPKMPAKIRGILHEDWNVLDPQGEEMISTFSKYEGAVEFAHASTTFYEHLKGTFGLLAAWNQPEDVRRAGLVHTGYSGDLFQFVLFDSNKEEDRANLTGIIGEKSEALVYLFGTVHRGDLCHFKDAVNRVLDKPQCPPIGSPPQTVHHRSEAGTIDVNLRDAANILMVTIADYLDQMVDTNGWRDHHQMEDGGKQLYPGTGRPALGFYWFSSVCHAIKEHLEVTPPIFNHCQDTISYQDEQEARDLYWKVTLEEDQLTEEQQLQILQQVVTLNPFIAEPHILISQLHYRRGNYHQAAIEARFAIEKFYTLASNWDKRRSFGHWVGFARVLLLRANRMIEQEEHPFPSMDPENPLYVNYNNLKLANLHDVVAEMKAREE